MLIVLWWKRRATVAATAYANITTKINRQWKDETKNEEMKSACSDHDDFCDVRAHSKLIDRCAGQLISLTVFYERITTNCTHLIVTNRNNVATVYLISIFPPKEMDDFFICFYFLAGAVGAYCLLVWCSAVPLLKIPCHRQ